MLDLSKSPPSPSYHLPSPATFRRPSPNRPTLTLFRYSAFLLTKRYCRLLFLTLFALTFLFFLLKLSPPPSFEPLQLIRIPAGQDLVLLPPPYPSPPTDEQRKGLPPLFEAWKEYERALPQHAADNGTTRFIYMKNHVVASGWGNVLQEMILNTHLAFLSGRSFVFDNYTWDRSTSEYSSFNGKTIPSRVPVSTMLAGPIIGGSFDLTNLNDPFFTVDPSSTSHPRAVSSEYYERVCDGQKKIVDTAIVRNAVESWDGKANLEAWVKYLQNLPDRCVEFDINAQHIFHIWMFGSPKVLTLWPSLSESPILRQFTHSPLILAAFERHRHLFGVVDTKPAKPKGQLHFVPSLGTPNINDTIPGLLVLHVRRGDFAEHCVHLVKYSSAFNGFNSFEDMRDQDGFDPAAAAAKYETAKANYLERCFPNVSQIVKRVRQVRERVARAPSNLDSHSHRTSSSLSAPLTHLYIMTNGKPPFLAELRAALELDAITHNPFDLPPWESIYTSRDLELGWEEGYVAQALDMYVAQRAEVFIGNGFSSLTSNIVMLRKANGVDTIKTRLW
ncbi:hypothetical protein EV360DRAFT_48433 [Lentinula raphanica]|nr:hypothetical protein EV360DRAFT_48433 [Lentinula raphanica]